MDGGEEEKKKIENNNDAIVTTLYIYSCFAIVRQSLLLYDDADILVNTKNNNFSV